jgi:hypothetical protein
MSDASAVSAFVSDLELPPPPTGPRFEGVGAQRVAELKVT